MEQFLFWSLIGSIALTLGLNLLSVTAPEKIARLQFRLTKTVSTEDEMHQDQDKSMTRFFLPFEALLIVSLVMMIALNIGAILVT
ncbi:MAG: hypothetical protein ACSHX3_06555 [Litorimonas sp.]